ncbi:MAG: glutamate racemase [Chitinivibrionales bacterium]|nr:glutamate racemase [Chitinivibrionales bacterium]
MVSDQRPIGVFDSGLGGLTVAREILRLMPGEQIVYLGDTARFPYGGRSKDAICSFAGQDADFLIAQDIKMLIVACNTASAVGIEAVREMGGELPTIGVVLPGAKAAVLRTADRKIGIIGTRATIKSEAYTQAIHDIDNDIKVYGKECPLFAPLVEEGWIDTDATRLIAQNYLYHLVDIGIDCIVLGCTHYPLLMEVIQGTVGTRIQLIDSAFWTAKEAQDILSMLDLLSSNSRDGLSKSIFYLTDMTPNFEESAESFLGEKVPAIRHLPLDRLIEGGFTS